MRLHMKSESQMQKAKVISEALNTKFFHHGYPVSRTEAREIGLPIAASNEHVERLMWAVWLDIEEELQFRHQFSPVRILRDNPACAALFGAAPAGAPSGGIASASFEQVAALMESARSASRFTIQGEVLGLRQPDLNLKISIVPHKEGWNDQSLPAKVKTSKVKKKSVSKKKKT